MNLFQAILKGYNIQKILQLDFQMIRKQILILFLWLIVSVYSSESLLKGVITFADSKQTAVLRPLSQQPKVANIKNSLFQFLIIPEVQSCATLKKQLFTREQNQPPVLAVMDLSTNTQLTCGMSNKIAKIKEAGGYGFIIVTDNNAFIINHCKMYDSNNFFTGVMDSINFEILKKQKAQPIIGSLTISPKDSNRKLLEVWTSSLNPASYDNLILLSNVFGKLPSLDDKVEWTPRIASLGCTHGDNTNICSKADNVASCACKGQFCSPQAHEKTPKILVQEDIRQLLIFRQYSTKYFQYIRQFRTQCLPNYVQSKYSEDCANNVMNKLEIDSFSINTAISSFIERCSNDNEAQAMAQSVIFTTLEKDRNAFVNYGRYPLILLNKQILEFKSEDDLTGQFCRNLSLQDEGCFEVSSKTLTTVTGTLFYVLLIILLISIGAGVVYFYRKKLKRDMNKQIKMQVSTAVEHYFALTDVK